MFEIKNALVNKPVPAPYPVKTGLKIAVANTNLINNPHLLLGATVQRINASLFL